MEVIEMGCATNWRVEWTGRFDRLCDCVNNRERDKEWMRMKGRRIVEGETILRTI